MRIKMRTLCAGPTGVWQPGQIVDVPPREAAELVAAGSAEAIDAPPALPREKIETRPRTRPGRETRADRRKADKTKVDKPSLDKTKADPGAGPPSP